VPAPADASLMALTKARVRVLFLAAWLATGLLLIYFAGFPVWLAFIVNVAGGAVIGNYARGFPERPLSRGEEMVRMAAYVIVGTIAAGFALLLAVTVLAFLVAWAAN
jgi:hypothetical protein